MTVAGFDVYAHLRLRDHRPGNSTYELPPLFGPRSSSRKHTITSRHAPPPVFVNKVGPGAYDVPSTIGRGRATRIAPAATTTSRDAGAATADKAAGRAAAAVVSDVPAQYSMARMPDTPAFSIYGRLKSTLELNTTPSGVGPGSYNVSSGFAAATSSARRPQPSTCHAADAHAPSSPRRGETTPGPGAYNVKRFGDDVPPPREPPLPLRLTTTAAAPTTPTPGPGAYDDPTSIASRLLRARQRPRMCATSTFAGRRDAAATAWVRYGARPGPGAYDVAAAFCATERHRARAPAFGKPPPLSPRSPSRRRGTATPKTAAASLITLPSDFDYNYKKGKSMLPRWHDRAAVPGAHATATATPSTVGPGSYNVAEAAAAAMTPARAVRFAPAPHEAFAAEAAAAAAAAKASPRRGAAASAQQSASSETGGVDEAAKYAAVLPRSRCALLTGQRDLHTHDNRVPGPGHYHVTQDAIDATTTTIAAAQRGGGGGGACRAGVFYRGDFHVRGADAVTASDTGSGGPGAHYDDTTCYSRSIAGEAAAGKGYTFGVRYPARALYQVCAPRDASTNVNCTYDDERTWESPPVVATAATTHHA